MASGRGIQIPIESFTLTVETINVGMHNAPWNICTMVGPKFVGIVKEANSSRRVVLCFVVLQVGAQRS